MPIASAQLVHRRTAGEEHDEAPAVFGHTGADGGQAIPIAILLLLQAAPPPADIELDLHVRAKSVTIEKKGEARLEVRGEGPGNRVEVKVEPKAEGRTELRDVRVDVHAEASIQEGVKIDAEAETGTPE